VDEDERIELEGVWRACQQLRSHYHVEVDRSPVMAAEGAFCARLEHSGNRIWINGHVLDRAPDPAGALEFLIHHELVHAVFINKLMEFNNLGLNLTEEQLADRIGIFALQITGL
jgi:hypothetical protein